MKQAWLDRQINSVENKRMKYSGSDFKFTSQANHLQKLLALKSENQRENIHAQRLYKRRKSDNGNIQSNWSVLNQSAIPNQVAADNSQSVFKPSTLIYVDNRDADDAVVAEWEPI